MNAIRWLVCIAYAAILTVLLFAPNPASVVGLRKAPELPWGDIGIHFTAFTVLAILVHATRWPRPPGWAIAILVAYGLATESLQGFVPPRSVELMDYVENLLGVAAGTGIYWVLWRKLQGDGPFRTNDQAQ